MKTSSSRQAWLSLTALFTGTIALIASLQGCAVDPDDEYCLDYACTNAASLTGSVPAEDSVRRVEAKYCSAQSCVEGLIELAPAEETACASLPPSKSAANDSLCLTLETDGSLRVEARLTRGDDQTLPEDGEPYTLELVDADSGRVLVDEARQADYETTRRDNCHWCWAAEMEL